MKENQRFERSRILTPALVGLVASLPLAGALAGNSDLNALTGSVSPTNGVPGAFLSVTSVTTNCAATSSSSSTTKIYLKIQPTGVVNNGCSSTQTLPSGSTLWFSHSVAALNGNKSYTNTSSRAIPSGLSAGNYDVIAVCGIGGGIECSACKANNTNWIAAIQVR